MKFDAGELGAGELRAGGLGTRLDLAMASAWPSASVVEHDGWMFRHAKGVTRRANSVLVAGMPSDLAAAIEAAEGLYKRRGSLPTFLISDELSPGDVSDELRRRGYTEDAPTWILHRAVNRMRPTNTDRPTWAVKVSETVSADWFAAYWAAEGTRRGPAAEEVFRHVLLKPSLPTRFVSLVEAGSVVSVGQVVIDGDIGCLQCLATMPDGRRRGAGSAVIEHLTEVAGALGVERVFAAVSADNDASLGLFDRLDYQRSHQYRYLIRS